MTRLEIHDIGINPPKKDALEYDSDFLVFPILVGFKIPQSFLIYKLGEEIDKRREEIQTKWNLSNEEFYRGLAHLIIEILRYLEDVDVEPEKEGEKSKYWFALTVEKD